MNLTGAGKVRVMWGRKIIPVGTVTEVEGMRCVAIVGKLLRINTIWVVIVRKNGGKMAITIGNAGDLVRIVGSGLKIEAAMVATAEVPDMTKGKAGNCNCG